MFVSFFFNLGEILSTLNQDSNDNVDDSLHVDETGKNNVEENVDEIPSSKNYTVKNRMKVYDPESYIRNHPRSIIRKQKSLPSASKQVLGLGIRKYFGAPLK